VTGRLIGLCYLGDWQPSLDALGLDDPRLPAIARNAIEVWMPGPWTPAHWGQPASIARWIAERLASEGITAGTRSVLLELKLGAERRAGALHTA